MHPYRWRAGLLCALASAPLAALAALGDELPAAPNVAIAAAAAAAAGAELYLEVSVNGAPTGQLLAARQSPRGLLVSRADLRLLGLNQGALAPGATAVAGALVEASDDVALDGIAGLTYKYDPATQALALTVDDSLRTPFALSARATLRAPRASASPGAVFNYNAIVQNGRQNAAVAALEARVFNERGVLSTSGVASSINGRRRFVRHDSFWLEADPDTLRTLRVGDTITSSLAWNRALRIGGVQWGKSFALRPDLATFPMPSIGGSAAVPSALSLYVNGVQQYSSEVPGGPFVLNQVGGVNGAGEATVVTRDAFGRATAVSLPLYVDARMLAAGLSDFSLEAGIPRGGFGQSSFGYHGAPVATGSGRYGWSDALTLEAHGEVAPRLLNAGAGALLAIGRFGVFSANLTASTGASGGAVQAGLGYQYVARRFSIDLQSQRAGRNYADLSTRDGSPAPRSSDRAALSLALGANLSMNASYAGYRAGYPGGSAGAVAAQDLNSGRGARIVSLGVTRGFRGGVFASLSAFDNLDQRASRGVFLSVSMSLGSTASGSVVAGRQNGQSQLSVNASGSPDLAGGAGWSVQEVRQGESTLRSAQLQYLGRHGQLALTAQNTGSGNVVAVEGTGALVLMDGTLAAARSVGAGFALVSTSGVAGVPVLHENRVIGVTDAGGHLLLPTLNSNVGNNLAIDTTDLAADRRVPVTRQSVNPRSLSGMLVHFPIETYQAANVTLVDVTGAPLPVGAILRHRESGKDGMVGFDGMAFVDDLQALNHLDVELGAGGRCAAQFGWKAVDGDPLPTIGPVRCLSAATTPSTQTSK